MKMEEIISAFNGLNSSRNLAEKIEVLEKKVRAERLRLGGIYYVEREKWCKDNGLDIERNSENPKYLKRYYEDQKKIQLELKPMNDELNGLLAEQKNAREKYVSMVQNNECWNDLVHRKVAPKILEHLEKNGAKTEVQLVDELKGGSENIYSQYCYPLFDMEKLGWIVREGSGKVGDQRLCKLTDLGRQQLRMFQKNKSFNINLQFNI